MFSYQHFIDAGVEIEIGGPDYFYGSDELLRYRWIADRLQIGVKASFDRWANSVDFVLHRCDVHRLLKVDVEKLRTHVDRQVSMGRYDKGNGLRMEIRLRDMK
jgi:hypothetical protein